ncbi:ATP-dependent RecD-like DNA helicase [Rhizobium sp. SSA_523]|uniref:ATP-dependent DNA helicase n=1 Tax=Rhizobium sp. SSA_523 TaxID=2952477 RepID=UPI002091D9E1|nr:ATP-dependent RecD-like DNA helicase [Rhizobium sp. SSA_523]MCO5730154.1 ATP-dependent RecD-like DNA helicase [Rhizobium sp. SSA_523]WKC25219.1 ATP-dependent RecD-like DNA helicase [Rhizobium sp. SSA_523]
MTTWSPQQEQALAKAGAWLRMRYQPVFRLFGFAGTGKTTLAIHLAQHASGKVAFAAFTGKAAMVMRSKGCIGAKTIHSLIYESETDPITGEVRTSLRHRESLSKFCLIVIDECSMVNEEIGNDLLSFGIPILVLGDPAQLPPVKGGGFFTEQQPDFMLTEVHRQAADSPIIWLATEIREGRYRRDLMNTNGLVITDRGNLDPVLVRDANIVLVGRNDTRMKFNRRLREHKVGADLAGNNPLPVVGEPLICLRNDKETKIFNGDILTVSKKRVGKKSIQMTMEDQAGDRSGIKVTVRKEFFHDDVAAGKLPYKEIRGTQQFTYGYAITCHKAQGSQWRDVCVFDESNVFGDDRARWLYTACTRAAEQLTLVI